jgi:uncharacterized membrane protein (UPF0136 family)
MPISGEALAMVLGSLVPVGGTIGYLRKGSRPSLFSGLVTGGLFWLSWHLTRNAGQAKNGNLVGLVTSLILALAMLGRYVASKKRVPLFVCLVAALSAAVFAGEVTKADV